jgi:hypothetical protein
MEEINHDMTNVELITPYQLNCLLRQHIQSQDTVTYRSLFEQVIHDVRQSLRNKLDEE